MRLSLLQRGFTLDNLKFNSYSPCAHYSCSRLNKELLLVAFPTFSLWFFFWVQECIRGLHWTTGVDPARFDDRLIRLPVPLISFVIGCQANWAVNYHLLVICSLDKHTHSHTQSNSQRGCSCSNKRVRSLSFADRSEITVRRSVAHVLDQRSRRRRRNYHTTTSYIAVHCEKAEQEVLLP